MKLVCLAGCEEDFAALKPVAKALGCDVFRTGHFASLSRRDIVFLAGSSYTAASEALDIVDEGIPIAHIGGGQPLDGPAGVYQDVITRCASLHFAFTPQDATRLLWRVRAPEAGLDGVETAEDIAPARGIHVVGHPALDGTGVVGPMGDGRACERIAAVIEEWSRDQR